MNKIKVIAVTGIRSEYDIILPILKEINNNKNFDLKLVISGAHLSEWHGDVIGVIEKDGFNICDKIDSYISTNRNTQRIKGLGLLLLGLSQTIERENPDFLLVIGDREESIATALVGNYMNILVAHYGGGDTVYGNADDPIRFATSQLSHIHLTAANQSSKKLESVGEDKFRIFTVGNPAYDNISSIPDIHIDEISKYLDFDLEEEKYLVLIKHPLSSEKKLAGEQMKITLRNLELFSKENNYKVIGIYPNTDPGSFDIIEVIDSYKSENYIKFFKNIKTNIFVNLIRKCSAIVGNSSMGILEAPFYKKPVVNIGNRQKGRLNAGNVVFVDYDKNQIQNALNKACFDKEYINNVNKIVNPYGDGKSSKRISEILLSINPNDNRWLTKKISS